MKSMILMTECKPLSQMIPWMISVVHVVQRSHLHFLLAVTVSSHRLLDTQKWKKNVGLFNKRVRRHNVEKWRLWDFSFVNHGIFFVFSFRFKPSDDIRLLCEKNSSCRFSLSRRIGSFVSMNWSTSIIGGLISMAVKWICEEVEGRAGSPGSQWYSHPWYSQKNGFLTGVLFRFLPLWNLSGS